MKDEHVRDEPVKDAAQDVAEDVTQDVTQDVAEDVSGAAEDGGVKAFILPIGIFQRRNPRTTAHAFCPPRLHLGDT